MDLSDEDPDVFQTYLNLVYIGHETIGTTSDAFELEIRDSTTGFPDFWVYNVCKDVTKENLIKLFEEFGEIKTCKVKDDTVAKRKHESERSVHFSFATAESGGKALKARDGFIFHGHRLRIQYTHGCAKADDEHYTRRYQLADIHFETLVRLYLLTDKLQDRAAANVVIDKIKLLFGATASHPGLRPIFIAYESTAAGSPLRSLLRDLWFYDACGDAPIAYRRASTHTLL